MKICFYSPYVGSTFGGGERYLFDVARIYASKHEVYMAISSRQKSLDLEVLKKEYADFLQADLSKINFIWTPLGDKKNSFQKVWWTRRWDAIYYQTDGSTFFSLARRSILHIQIPLPLYKRNLWERIKLRTFRVKNTNSYFTKKVIEKYWNVKINLVHQPGIEMADFANNLVKKTKIILHVGRFFEGLHVKNQDVLVNFFTQLQAKYPQELKGWQLVLIGNVESQNYAALVSKLAANNPQIKILHGVKRQELVDYYKKASIYWHATGFFDDQTLHPERMEHFGISTLEAMAAGAVPIVIDKGGQPEVVGKNLRDLLWLTQRECARKTLKVIGDANYRRALAQAAVARAQKFDAAVFEKKAWRMLEM